MAMQIRSDEILLLDGLIWYFAHAVFHRRKVHVHCDPWAIGFYHARLTLTRYLLRAAATPGNRAYIGAQIKWFLEDWAK